MWSTSWAARMLTSIVREGRSTATMSALTSRARKARSWSIAKEGYHHSACNETVYKSALCGGPHESFSRNASFTYLRMSSVLRMIYLNVSKQGLVYESLMNDKEIEDVAVLAM